jgi:hypothetical protein
MRTLGRFCIALLLAGGLFAQYRGSPAGRFGSVVFPGGTPATMPGVTRNFGSVVNPGSGGPRITMPGVLTAPTFGARPGAAVAGQNFSRLPGTRHTGVILYPYPVYVGGYYDNPYPVEPAAAQQPNVVVIYPPQQAPVIINQFGSADSLYVPTEAQPARELARRPSGDAEPPRYLIAFKDRTVYSAVAYWVDGDTLHYFTSGNTHNQVSVSLIDRALTERLNKESGVEVKLPAAK